MKKIILITLAIVALGFISFFYYFLRQGQFWDSTSRMRVLLGSPNAEAQYLLIDPKRGEIAVYGLDNSEEVEAAYGLGKWKIGSLWKLGVQENKGGGEMTAKSLVRGYGLPVEGYLQYGGPVEPFSLARSLIFAKETNMYLRDRLTLAWFVLHARVSNESALTQSTIILTAEELSAVTDGIVTITNTQNLTDRQSKAVSLLVSNLGGKVLDFSTLQDNIDQYCSVSGKSIFAQKLAHVLNCNFTKTDDPTTHLALGNEFAKNF